MTNVGKDSLDKYGWVSVMHKRDAQALGLGLKIQVPAAQASEAEK